MSQKREHWSGKLGFILAASGSAVGLGNLWKFPYITWQNGGGLFVLIYLLCILLIGLPIMIAEIALGKISSRDPVGAFDFVSKRKTRFRYVGILGVLSAFVILSFYSVVAGWSIEYSIKSISSDFKSIPYESYKEALTDDRKVKALQKAVFEEALTQPLTDIEKREILHAALSQKTIQQMPFDEINELFKKEKKNLISLLKENKQIETWQNYFLAKRSKRKDFNEFMHKTLLPVYSSSLFADFLNNWPKVSLWHLIIMSICLLIVSSGIKKGIEKTTKFLMPLLLLLMFFMMINSLMLDKEQEGVKFLLFGDPGKLHGLSIPEAMGHAFFTLSLGMGAMLTYGSYMKKDSDVVSDALWVTGLDTLIALIACMMIFPIIFVYGLEPTSGGIGILFTTLPLELFKFSYGYLLAPLFYILVFLAALTSAISLLEVAVTYLKDEWNLDRDKASLIAAGAIFLVGIPSAISVSFMEYPDALSTNIMLPLGGLLIAIFMGHKAEKTLLENEFIKHKYPKWSFDVFYFTLRYITPALVTIVFIFLLSDLVKKIVS